MTTKEEQIKTPNIYDRSCFLSKWFFCWLIPIYNIGFTRDLGFDDICRCCHIDEPARVSRNLELEWSKELNKQSKVNKYKPSIIKAIVRAFWLRFTLYQQVNIWGELIIRLFQPFLVGYLVRYLTQADVAIKNDLKEPDLQTYSTDFNNVSVFSTNYSNNENIIPPTFDIQLITHEEAIYYAAALIVSSFIFAMSRHTAFILSMRIANNVRTALTVMIYRKILKLSKSSFENVDIGQILNIIANDLNRFEDVGWLSAYLLVGPVMSIVVIYVTYTYLGIACIGGLVIVMLFIPFQGLMGRLFDSFRSKTTKLTDTRVRIMGEIITAMKLIKLYCWEAPFAEKVAIIRKEEIRTIRRSMSLRGINLALFFVATRVMLFASFIIYVLMGNPLDAETVFVIMSLFNSIRLPVTLFFPQAIGTGAETLVACKRVERILLFEERNEKSNVNPLLNKGQVNFIHFSGKWTKTLKRDYLKNIDLEISPGQLIVVIGTVGAGKTCLLHSILNEIEVTDGSVQFNGRLSYAPQESWCFTGSIKENILLGAEFDERRYHDVIKCCGLQRDLTLFPNGDDTFVGEKGYSLSGGQKARVTLARAVYNKADVYLLDDPLSAVDPKVSNHIFDRCIKEHLKDKTVILVTHQLQFLTRADKIVVLKDGVMIASGDYNELIKESVDFLSFLEKEKDEEVEKEKLSKQKSLSIKDVGDENDILSESVGHNKSMSNKSIGSVSSGKHRQLFRSNSTTNRSRTSSLSQQSGSFQGDEEVKEVYNDDHLGQGMTREEKSKDGSISGRVYWDYLRSGASVFFIFAVFAFAFATQALYHYTDLWLADWTSTFEPRVGYVIENVTRNGNESIDDLNDERIIKIHEDYIEVNNTVVEYNEEDQTNNAIKYSVLISVLFISAFIRTSSFYYLCLRCSVNLHDMIFKRVLRAPMLFFENNPLGRILNRLTRDVGIIDQVIPNSVVELQMNLINVLGIIMVSIIVELYIAIPSFILGLLAIPVRLYYVRTGRAVQRLDSLARSPVYAHITATFDGLTTVRAFGLQDMFDDQYIKYMNDSVACRWLVFCSGRIIGIILDGFANVYIAAICIVLVATPAGSIPGGQAGLILASSLTLIGMFQYGVRLSAEFETQMVSTERVLEYGSLEQEAELRIENRPLSTAWPDKGSITFNGVSLKYSKELPPVLKNLNFQINPGERIGIVGRTGAGKSSLISLLFRLVEPDSGTVIIDGIDISSLGLHELREKISIIPQDPTLFSGTIRNNLDPFAVYDDDKLWEALRASNLDETVKNMPKMLDANVTEGGSNLSVGQRQLLCLSRALLKNNRILILDEATANVDHETDEIIQKTIKTGFVDCTVLTVAHRLNTIIDADRILVMDAGQVVEFDNPHILLSNSKGMFHSMVHQTGREFEKMLHNMAQEAYDQGRSNMLNNGMITPDDD